MVCTFEGSGCGQCQDGTCQEDSDMENAEDHGEHSRCWTAGDCVNHTVICVLFSGWLFCNFASRCPRSAARASKDMFAWSEACQQSGILAFSHLPMGTCPFATSQAGVQGAQLGHPGISKDRFARSEVCQQSAILAFSHMHWCTCSFEISQAGVQGAWLGHHGISKDIVRTI